MFKKSCSFPNKTEQTDNPTLPNADDLRRRIMQRMNITQDDNRGYYDPQETPWTHRTDISSTNEEAPFQTAKSRLTLNRKKEQDLSTVKIKTLAEIRAEKKEREELSKKRSLSPSSDEKSSKARKLTEEEISSTSAEVSSTSKTEEEDINNKTCKRKATEENRGRKPKIRRPLIKETDEVVSSVQEEEKKSVTETSSERDTLNKSESEKSEEKSEKSISSNSKNDSKVDEMLLLDEDDFEYSNVSLQAEEDLLKDIDDLLSE